MNLPRTEVSAFADRQGRKGFGGASRRLDEASVRELAAVAGEPVVTSVYLDIDGRRRPALADCDAALESLFRQARRQAAERGSGWVSAVEAGLTAIQAWIAQGVDRAHARGLAFFCNGEEAGLEVFVLPVPVRDQLSLGERPNVEQLEEILDRARPLLVALTDAQQGRLLRLRAGEPPQEVATIVDPVERQVDTDVELGSWEHRHEEATRRHLRRVADAVVRHVQHRGVEALVVGGPTPAAEALVDLLPAGVADRIAGRINVAVAVGEEDLAEVLSDLEDHLEERRQAQLVDDLRSRVGSGRAVAGLEDTLVALNEKRVETLIVARDFGAAGARCPTCGHLDVGARDCPWCGTVAQPVDNVVDAAVALALEQRATVKLVATPDMADQGGIGALERHRSA